MNVIIAISLCLVFVNMARGMYSGSSVVELTPSNFDKYVLQSNELWLVEFYAPWCGHCQALTPEWKKAATALQGLVKVGAVNADEHQSLGGQYGVRGFPTIKVFGLDKKKPTDYQGPRQASGIVDAAMSAATKMAKEKLSGKRGSGGGSGGGSGKQADPEDVIELTDSNFQKLVLDSEDMWLVEFFAPWCGHCKNLAPQWAQAATELKGKVKLGALDATVHTVMASRYQVRGYPTIKYFPAGKKDDAQEYDGGRTSSDIVQWALDKFAENVPPPEVYEIVSKEVFDETCQGKQLCIIAVLPNILDCQSKCRNNHIEMLKKLGEKNKKKVWGWLWVEGGAQPHLEEALEIGGFGYPAMAAINYKKMVFSILRSSYDEAGISEFLRNLSYGKGRVMPMAKKQMPDIATNEPWDGKDGELPQEEDIDLSDVVLDDLEKDEL